MARGGGGGGGRSFGGGGGYAKTAKLSSSKVSKPAAKTPAPTPAPAPAPAPAPSPSQSVMETVGSGLKTLGTSIADGFGWGVGTSVGHRAVEAVLGPRTIHVETTQAAPAATATNGFADACGIHMKTFTHCLSSNASDISKCQFYMDMLTNCKRNSGGAEISA